MLLLDLMEAYFCVFTYSDFWLPLYTSCRLFIVNTIAIDLLKNIRLSLCLLCETSPLLSSSLHNVCYRRIKNRIVRTKKNSMSFL